MKKCELSIPEATRIALGVNEANRLHQYATAQAEMAVVAGKNAVLAVLRLGRLLKDLKAATVHGEWGQLFKKESNTKLSSCAQFETQANVAHELHLNFNRQTANRYMRCYQEAAARLGQDERPALDMGLDGEAVETLPELVKKATGNAVTPRQMMLNLQVVKDGSKSAAHAARLAQHETILRNRGKGRAAAPVSPEQAMMAAVAGVQPEEELREQKKQVAMGIRTVELTGLASQSCSWQWRNFTAAQVSFQLGREMMDAAPFSYKERVRVAWDGVTVLDGTVRKCDAVLSPSGYVWQVEICDHWKPMEGTTFFGSGIGAGRIAFSFASFSGLSSGASVKRRIKIAAALRTVLDNARKHGALVTDYVLDVDDSAWIWDTDVACDKHASLLRKFLSSRPGMVAWFDYSGASPVLHIADGDRLDPVTLDRIAHRLSKIQLAERVDLVPPAVGVVMTRGKYATSTVVHPTGADLHQEGCTIVQLSDPRTGDDPDDTDEDGVDGPQYNFAKPEMMVLGEKMPTGPEDARKWWTNWIPELAKVPGAQFGAIQRETPAVEGQDAKNYSTSATKYRLAFGDLSESCTAIKWCEVVFKQYVYIDSPPKKGFELIFPRKKTVTINGDKVTRYYNWLTWRGITTNVRRRSYKVDRHGTLGPEDGSAFPPPSEGSGSGEADWPNYRPVLEAYYQMTRVAPWAGSVDALAAIRPDLLLGRRLSIAGANPAWLDMRTVIQGVTVDLSAGNTYISTGVPDHLSLQSMIDRQQQLYSNQAAMDDRDNQDQVQDNPALSLTYDSNARISPKAPTVSPRGEVIWSSATPEPNDYGFRVQLEYDEDGQKTGATITPGKIMLHGRVLGDAPASKDLPMMEGEVWLNLILNETEEITGMAVISSAGTVDPFMLTSIDGARPSRLFYYSFPLAVIKGDEVIQYALGTIQLPVGGGTYYPWGP